MILSYTGRSNTTKNETMGDNMEEKLIYYFNEYENIAMLISISVNVIVTILGVIPSFFITGANLIFFGFWTGTWVSFVGEALGSIIAFYLYRKGFKKVSQNHLQRFPKIKKLINTGGKDAFYMILLLRLLPVPSGLITLAGAIGRISFVLFAIASTVGKFPALLLEAYAVYQVTQFEWQGKLILTIVAFYFLYILIRKKQKVTSA
jgi:uncharacterized membrane protein YdjX (TVP38/TMEM64 family)